MSVSEQQPELVQVLLLGDVNVGKTSFATHLRDGSTFDPDARRFTTVGVDFFTVFHDLPVLQETVRVQLWDAPGGMATAAQLVPAYCRGNHVFILVYDVTQRTSFMALKTQWVPLYRDKYTPNIGNTVTILIGNKRDKLVGKPALRRVTQEEARTFAEDIGALHFYELSALAVGEEALADLRLPLDIALTAVLEKRRVAGTLNKQLHPPANASKKNGMPHNNKNNNNGNIALRPNTLETTETSSCC